MTNKCIPGETQKVKSKLHLIREKTPSVVYQWTPAVA